MVPLDAPEHIPVQGDTILLVRKSQKVKLLLVGVQGGTLWERMLCALEQGALMGASSLSNKQPVAAAAPAAPDTHTDNRNKITAKVEDFARAEHTLRSQLHLGATRSCASGWTKTQRRWRVCSFRPTGSMIVSACSPLC